LTCYRCQSIHATKAARSDSSFLTAAQQKMTQKELSTAISNSFKKDEEESYAIKATVASIVHYFNNQAGKPYAYRTNRPAAGPWLPHRFGAGTTRLWQYSPE
jgi:hypothetical protein